MRIYTSASVLLLHIAGCLSSLAQQNATAADSNTSSSSLPFNASIVELLAGPPLDSEKPVPAAAPPSPFGRLARPAAPFTPRPPLFPNMPYFHMPAVILPIPIGGKLTIPSICGEPTNVPDVDRAFDLGFNPSNACQQVQWAGNGDAADRVGMVAPHMPQGNEVVAKSAKVSGLSMEVDQSSKGVQGKMNLANMQEGGGAMDGTSLGNLNLANLEGKKATGRKEGTPEGNGQNSNNVEPKPLWKRMYKNAVDNVASGIGWLKSPWGPFSQVDPIRHPYGRMMMPLSLAPAAQIRAGMLQSMYDPLAPQYWENRRQGVLNYDMDKADEQTPRWRVGDQTYQDRDPGAFQQRDDNQRPLEKPLEIGFFGGLPGKHLTFPKPWKPAMKVFSGKGIDKYAKRSYFPEEHEDTYLESQHNPN